jgi:phage terminase Nu1 subunit (DNA packaging protein)
MEVTKGQFAVMMKVSPGRVSQWIADGKIGKAALIGTGVRAKINAEIAREQLGRTLDPVQLAAQNRELPELPTEAPALAERKGGGQPLDPVIDSDQVRFNRARADRAEIEAEQARRELDAERGRYTLAEAALREWTKQAKALIDAEHEWHRDLALVIASELGIEAKAVEGVLRREFRVFCQKRSDLALAALAQIEQLQGDLALSTETGNG